MRSNYKRLGGYIRQVDIRNLEDKKNNLFGVSTQKVFIHSIANTIGTDFKSYKVIKEGQFAYVPDTSRRGDKIGIALLSGKYEGLVSQAYIVFEVSETEKLIPEYLMMWFKRPEFDRYARYKSQGSVREIFDWNEMCDVQLPIPSIDKQKSIVQEYNTLANRITLNNQLNQKLEETAQSIYKQWFVDFEFPDENGKPYKSNGGEMVESEMGEIPQGWRVGTLEDLGKVVGGATPSKDREEYYTKNGIAWITPKDLSGINRKFVSKGEIDITELGYKKASTQLIPSGSVLFSSRAPIGYMAIALNELCTNQGFKSIVPEKNIGAPYVYYFLHFKKVEIACEATGSTFDEVSGAMMKNVVSLIPDERVALKFKEICDPIFSQQEKFIVHVSISNNLKNLLLSKLSFVA